MRSKPLGRAVSALPVALLLLGSPVLAQQPVSQPEKGPPPSVDLEELLKLPDSMRYDVEKRGGATRGEWRARYQKIRADLAHAEKALKANQKELERVAGSADAWTLSPPGAEASSDAPLDFRLRQEIRRARDEVERLKKRLRDLDIEANLAGVPDDWRE